MSDDCYDAFTENEMIAACFLDISYKVVILIIV